MPVLKTIPQAERAPLVAKPASTRRNALVVVVVVAVAGFAAATSAKQSSPLSAVAASKCDTPTSGQTCGLTKKGTTSGFVEGHAYTPCYCSHNEGTHTVQVDVLGCLGKCDAGHQCPHVIPSFVHDTGPAAGWPYPHVSIIVDGGVEVDIKKFKAVLRDAAHNGGSENWWKPDLAKAKLTSFPMIHLLDKNGGPSTTLKNLCDAIKANFPDIKSCTGMEKPHVISGPHMTIPEAWVSNGKLKQSEVDYLRGETSGHLTWWVSIFYVEENCWEKYPYHLASA